VDSENSPCYISLSTVSSFHYELLFVLCHVEEVLCTNISVISVLKLIAYLNVLILCVEKVMEVTQKLSCLHITQILLSEPEDNNMIQKNSFMTIYFFKLLSFNLK
jgi:hypothetical protein